MPIMVETNIAPVAAIMGHNRESAMRWFTPNPMVKAPPPAISPAEGWPTRTPVKRQMPMAIMPISGV